jgi:hypothetical protein
VLLLQGWYQWLHGSNFLLSCIMLNLFFFTSRRDQQLLLLLCCCYRVGTSGCTAATSC